MDKKRIEVANFLADNRVRLLIAGLLVVSLTLLVFVVLCCDLINWSKEENIQFKSVISTGMSKQNKPLDSRSEISLQEKKIYFFATFYNLEAGKSYQFTCQFVDSSGLVVFKLDTKPFTPKGSSYHQWCWYGLNPMVDPTGTWWLLGALNGKPMIEQRLEVTP